jgi:bifunctional non-homologous end joining protein LigD
MALSKKVTLYHRASGGRVKVWSVYTDADRARVYREWGLLDGTTQQTHDDMASRGVMGTLSYKAPLEVMREQVARLIKQKSEEGYVPLLADVRDTVQEEGVLDFTSLPDAFAPAKPVADVDIESLMEWDAEGLLLKQRKRDGERLFGLITPQQKVRLYTRRLKEVTANMPRIVRAFQALTLPPCTVLDMEAIVDRDGDDDFRAVAGITRAKPDKAAAREAVEPFKVMLFDVLFWDGTPKWKQPYLDRYARVKRLAPGSGDLTEYDIIAPSVIHEPFEDACDRVRKNHWEGLVCWRTDEASVLQMNGHPKRCNAYKWKPIQNGDFVAVDYELGTGRHAAQVGALFLAEYVDGVLVEIGKCGTGFDDETRKAALSWRYPCVVEVNYDKQEEDSGALRFPVFVRRRPDKTPAECVRRG